MSNYAILETTTLLQHGFGIEAVRSFTGRLHQLRNHAPAWAGYSFYF